MTFADFVVDGELKIRVPVEMLEDIIVDNILANTDALGDKISIENFVFLDSNDDPAEVKKLEIHLKEHKIIVR